MRRFRLFSLLMIGVIAFTFSACAKKEEVTEVVEQTEEVNMFGITEEEQKLYAEYAAGVLMKYNAGSNNRVLEGQKLIQVEAKEEAIREQELRREQLAQEYQNNKSSSSKDSISSSPSKGNSTDVSYISDMAQATGMEEFSIRYIGCEVTDSYPKDGEDVFMAMEATSGKVLMVAEFEVTNNSGETKNFDMYANQGKFKLKTAGKTYKSQYTLLLNDLSMYKGELESGETIETVLIFEIPQSEAGNTDDMTLAITVAGNTEYMSLNGNVSSDVDMNVLEEDVEEDTTEEDTTKENAEEDNNQEEAEDISSDLAEEYMEALERLESEGSYEGSVEDSTENVTVVGSNRN